MAYEDWSKVDDEDEDELQDTSVGVFFTSVRALECENMS
jgi:hypothetical protein